jgi:hypothetical protein
MAQVKVLDPFHLGSLPGTQRLATWLADWVRIVVAGQLSREAHNAPLHLFSASPELLGFARGTYRQRSERTSRLLGQLFERFQGEGFLMPYTMEDFERDYIKEHFPKLTPQEQQEVLQSLPLEKRLAGLSPEQIRQYLEQLTAGRPAAPRKPRRKK